MEAAFDLLALDHAVGEVGEAMGAAAFGRIEGAADVVDRDQFARDLAADHAVLRHIGGGTDGNFGHGSIAARLATPRALAPPGKSASGAVIRMAAALPVRIDPLLDNHIP